jgi:hypothetical protein
MSLDLVYTPATFDLGQLHEELLRASLNPELITTSEDGLDVLLSFPDETVEADVDAVVAAHVPRERYDSETKLAEVAQTREKARLRADYDRLIVLYEEVAALAAPVDSALAAKLREATVATVEVLKRRDRVAGIYS